MPTNITIRDIPDEVYAKLKKQGELHHRSIVAGFPFDQRLNTVFIARDFRSFNVYDTQT